MTERASESSIPRGGRPARRWLVLGASGAGKSTLSLELGRILKLPVVHLDRHYWRAGWVAPSDEEWDRQVSELVVRDEWIMDGNYSGTLSLRLPRAEVAILLDPPTPVCLWGVIRRGGVVAGARPTGSARGMSGAVVSGFPVPPIRGDVQVEVEANGVGETSGGSARSTHPPQESTAGA